MAGVERIVFRRVRPIVAGRIDFCGKPSTTGDGHVLVLL